MKSPLLKLKLDQAQLPKPQIEDFVHTVLHEQKIAPGTRMPSTRELAKAWRTPLPTVHAALATLVKEGLLVRQHGRGTFVRKREERLTCVGIYHTQENWTKGASDFERAVHAALAEEFDRLGVETRTWIDSRPKTKFHTPWVEMVRAVEHREIQGLIGLPGGWPSLRWINKLPIPSAHMTSANILNKVGFDARQLTELSLRSLAEQGCRSVGLICPISPKVTNPDGSRHFWFDFFECFNDVARDLGLKVRSEWMRVPKYFTRMSQGRYGYEEFLKLWSQSAKPEGLIVHPDSVAQGVILGVREKQVRVPEDLKLVFHKNESFDLLCPMPATFVISSEREFARALIEQVQKQFQGERCEPINVLFRLGRQEEISNR